MTDDESFVRAARNLAAYKVLPLAGLNVYDVLNYDELLMTVATARAIEARLGVTELSAKSEAEQEVEGA